MKLQIVSIRDAKAEAWMTPLFFQSKPQAIRSFMDAVNDPTSDFYKHPDDYVLFHLGSFDPETGSLTINNAPESLGVGTNFFRPQE